MGTSGQLAVRLSLLLIVGLAVLASEFGLDVILGAFAAGIVVGFVIRGGTESRRVRGQARRRRLRLPDPGLLHLDGDGLRPRRPAREPRGARSGARLRAALPARPRPAGAAALPTTSSRPTDRRAARPASRPRRCRCWSRSPRSASTPATMREEEAVALVGAGMLSVLLFPLLAPARRVRERRLASLSSNVRRRSSERRASRLPGAAESRPPAALPSAPPGSANSFS